MELAANKPIRVLVANRPRMMRELILTTFSDQPDIEIVDEVRDEADIPAGVAKTNPDFVIITQDTLGKRPGICDVVLREHPHTRFIALVLHHGMAVYYWAALAIHSQNIEASEESILKAIRSEGNSMSTLA